MPACVTNDPAVVVRLLHTADMQLPMFLSAVASHAVSAGALETPARRSDKALAWGVGGRTCFFSALKRTPFAMCSPHVSHQMLKGTSNLQEAQGGASKSASLPANIRCCSRHVWCPWQAANWMHVKPVQPQYLSGVGCDCVLTMQDMDSLLRQTAGHCVSHLMTRMPSSSFFALSRSGCWPWNCTHKDDMHVRAAASLGAVWGQLQHIYIA